MDTTTKGRMDQLMEMGLKFDGAQFIGKGINVHWTEMSCDTEEQWGTKMTKIKAYLKKLEETEAMKIKRIKTDKPLVDSYLVHYLEDCRDWDGVQKKKGQHEAFWVPHGEDEELVVYYICDYIDTKGAVLIVHIQELPNSNNVQKFLKRVNDGKI